MEVRCFRRILSTIESAIFYCILAIHLQRYAPIISHIIFARESRNPKLLKMELHTEQNYPASINIKTVTGVDSLRLLCQTVYNFKHKLEKELCLKKCTSLLDGLSK